ncbi:MAG: AAA family ATPase [Deltaproteobacteria bacterium]|nr:MAG: AAA family ATPase [Deltaproteobacteria bacterium]
MYRFALDDLKKWRSKPNRKPLIIRGARQVGKTHLVRLFAREMFSHLVEINFERDPGIASLFSTNDPKRISRLIELQFDIPVIPGDTLLFFDEIQAAPAILASLRYFYEDLPEQHIMAAGSLLEFVFEEPGFSMPVGRIEYMHLGPMQFEEFLMADGKDRLTDWLNDFSPGDDMPESVHRRLTGMLKTFLITGGMPEAVSVYLNSGSWQECESAKHALITTFQDDFNKYGSRVRHQRLQTLFRKIPLIVGQKFKYVNIDRNERAGDLAAALNLLCHARVCHRVCHSSCSGVPLGAMADEKKFKALFLDVGLMSSAAGLNLLDFEKAENMMTVNAGAVCEQFVGQHLLYSLPSYRQPELCYWVREKRNSSAETDYVIAEGTSLIPIEVKAGKSGTLKSLHLFLREKHQSLGVRLNTGLPSVLDTETALPDGLNIPYRLLSLPLCMIGQVRRLIREQLGRM